MYRTIHILALTFGLLCLSSFRQGDPYFDCSPLIYNTTVAQLFHPESRKMDSFELGNVTVDTSTRARILMLDYSAYGGAYNEKIRGIINRYLPKTILTDFTEGSAEDLSKALTGCDVVVVAYPSASVGGAIKAYNKVLSQYVQQGGSVIFTGTHEYEVLQQFGLFDLDFGYFSKDRPIHALHAEHPVFEGVGDDVTLANFAYPLDISDSGFVTLADVGGYPVIGYKPSGAGKIIYIGVEYYFDEAASSQILINSINWSSKDHGPDALTTAIAISAEMIKSGNLKHSEEMLYAGSGVKTEQVDLKIYPNPYFSKATLDIELSKPTQVLVEMTDEVGRNIALILPKKTIGPGLCRFELPNLTPGIYFIQVQLGEKTYVRKVVKSASN
jgi:Secretion system C-terminal sorting domain